jgi:2-oxoglutarate dehydrogenase complex dehydrogenase (E1) component-like enzyme
MLMMSSASLGVRAGRARTGRKPPNGELVSALDGDWPAVEKAMGGKIAAKAVQKGESIDTDALRKATLDSVRALMMIRAYRMRRSPDCRP